MNNLVAQQLQQSQFYQILCFGFVGKKLFCPMFCITKHTASVRTVWLCFVSNIISTTDFMMLTHTGANHSSELNCHGKMKE